MGFSSDILLERKLLKRKVSIWRIIAIMLVAIIMFNAFPLDPLKVGQSYIAKVEISGFIQEDEYRINTIDSLASNENVKAVIVYINSPGGTVVGGESLFHSFKEISKKKPVVAMLGSQATSAAYMVALASDYIVAYQGTLTGSVGVLMQSFEATSLANKIGINPIIIKSSPLKAVPHPAEKMTVETKKAISSTVNNIYEMFVNLVINNRNDLSKEQIDLIKTGTVFTGIQALDVGLIDEIGTIDNVRQWFEKNNIEQGLEIFKIDLDKGKKNSLLNFFSYFFNIRHSVNQHYGLLSIW